MKKAEFQRLAKECAKFAAKFDEEKFVVVSSVCRSNIRMAIYRSYVAVFGVAIFADDDYDKSDKAMESFFEKCKDISHGA